MNKIYRQQEELVLLLKKNGASLVGFGDVSEIDPNLTFGFSTAISLAVQYDSVIANNLNKNEKLYHNHLESLNEMIFSLIKLTGNLLDNWNYQYKTIEVPPVIKSN